MGIVRHKKKKVCRKYVSNRKLLIEFAHIKIENVTYSSSFYNPIIYINLKENEEIPGSELWFYSSNVHQSIFSSDKPTSHNELNHFNIGEYKNLTTVYNSRMHRVCYIDANCVTKEEKGIYIIQNKHRMIVYWSNDPIEDIMESCEKDYLKYIVRKNNEIKRNTKKIFYKTKELSRQYNNRHKSYNRKFM